MVKLLFAIAVLLLRAGHAKWIKVDLVNASGAVRSAVDFAVRFSILYNVLLMRIQVVQKRSTTYFKGLIVYIKCIQF